MVRIAARVPAFPRDAETSTARSTPCALRSAQPASLKAQGSPASRSTSTICGTDPVGLGPDVNAEMTATQESQARHTLGDAAAIAEHAVWLGDDGQDRAAVEEWRRLFGSRMPRP